MKKVIDEELEELDIPDKFLQKIKKKIKVKKKLKHEQVSDKTDERR